MSYQIMIGDRECIEWPLLIPPTPEQASMVYERRRELSREGASTWPPGFVVYEYTGRRLMEISYNAKVWDAATGDLLFNPYDPVAA